ncbi:MAG: glycogen-binding domain-containing protein [Treponema sp.]
MKKLFAFISGSLFVSAALFADVTVKKVDGGKLEATFFYGNPRASEVLLAADFTGFADGAVPMTKTDKGFTYTKIFDAGTTVKYKFIVDGNWTEDVKAPDRVDDGFGGKNGLADLEMLAGGSSDMMMNEDAPKIIFGTFTNFGFQQKWDLTKKKDDGKFAADFNPESAGLNLKSYLKFRGKLIPHVPVFMEIALAEKDSFENIYKRGKLDNPGKGLQRLVIDNIFDPIDYYSSEGSNENFPYLGAFKTGIETKYVEWETGFKNAKLPSHKNVNWTTVDGDWEAGYQKVGGYNQFKTGSAFNEWLARVTDGNLQMDIALAPNRTADRAGHQYGFYGYVDATIAHDHYIDFQYNTALGKEYDKMFDTVYEQDFIVGYAGNFGPVKVKTNALFNLYGTQSIGGGKKIYYKPASSDVGYTNEDPKNKIDNVAMNANVTYANDMLSVMAGYRFRGAQANMMYVEEGSDDNSHISDQLGDPNSQQIFAKASVTPIAPLTIELKPWVEMNLTKKDSAKYAYDKDIDNVQLSVAPKVIYKISDTMTVDGGFTVRYNSTSKHKYKFGDEEYSAKLHNAGVHFNAKLAGPVSSLDFIYGYKASLGSKSGVKDQYGLHNLIASIGLPADTELQASISFLQKYHGVDNFGDTGVLPVGFSVGANKLLTKKYKTTLIGQFVYNIDPHKGFGDGWHNFSVSGYNISKHKDDGVLTRAAALRVGVNIDF